MNRIISFFRGSVRLHIKGISSESFMNFMAGQRLRFWDVVQLSELELECSVFASSYKKLTRLAEGKGFDITSAKTQGLPKLMSLAIHRPVFVAGFILCAFLLAVLPRFVWTIRIDGNETVQAELIRRIMDDYGVHFGADGRQIDSEMLKIRIMNDIPALKWCAVNQKGGCVTIEVAEREAVPDSEVDHSITNVIAERDGVITKTEIYGGFRRCRVGDAVEKGQILISGVESFEKSTQLTHAFGEIYAMTGREMTAKTPQNHTTKQYTGSSKTHYSLIIGRKRINLFGNTGILEGSCDKIIRREQLELPGAYTFPVWLEEETLIYYTPVQTLLDKKTAQTRLSEYSEASVKDRMIAGKILAVQHTIKRQNGCWVLSSTLSCEEMIARTVPLQIEESEKENGRTDH